MGAQFTAFLDANVLYSAPLTDLLLELAKADIFQARWSWEVLTEMKRNLLNNRPDLTVDQLDYRIAEMNGNIRDCLVEYPETLVDAIKGLHDNNDRHVVAAALNSRCHAIVTWNVKDFPSHAMTHYRLQVIDPDTFLENQFDLSEGRFLECVQKIRRRLTKPKLDQAQYINVLIRNKLVKIAAKLKPYELLI